MIISVLSETKYVSSSANITENVPPFINSVRTFNTGESLVSENKVYQRTGNDFTAPYWDTADESSYVLNQIVMKGSKLHYVSALAGETVAKQPEEYSPPTSTECTTWNNRYALLGSLDSSQELSFVSINMHHRIYQDNYGLWRHTLHEEVTDAYFEPYKYVDNQYLVIYNGTTQSDYTLIWYYNSIEVYRQDQIGPPAAHTAITIIGTDGHKYKTDGYTVSGTGNLLHYNIAREIQDDHFEERGTSMVTMLDECNLLQSENKAYCVTSDTSATTPCIYWWLSRTLIRRGNNIYVRSDTDDPVETKYIIDIEYTEITNLTQVNGWGWTYVRPTAMYAPLDGIQHTYVDAAGDVVYTVESIDKFDTVAINGLIANEVTVEFIPADSLPIPSTIILAPNTNRDVGGLLPQYRTTSLAYASRIMRGSVKLTFKNGTKNVRIGGIRLGLSVDVGFTNLVFTNKFKDYSPYEKDQFGNIMYIKGVKANIYTGSVDIELLNYDMTNRLMESLGGETVILNGSGTKDNLPMDNQDFFASTMIVGRIRNFALKTKLDNKLMHQMASYNFEIESDI